MPTSHPATIWIEVAAAALPSIIKLLKAKDQAILDALEDTEVTALRIKAKAKQAKQTA